MKMNNITDDILIKKIFSRLESRFKSIDSNDIESTRVYIKKVVEYIAGKQSNTDKKTIVRDIICELSEFNKEYCNTANLRGIYLELSAAQRLLNNPNKIAEMMKKIKEQVPSNRENIWYGGNFKKNESNVSTKIVDALIQLINERKIRNIDDSQLETAIIGMIKGTIAENEMTIKEQIKKNLQLVISFLDKFGFASEYIKSHNKKMELAEITELGLDALIGKYDKNNTKLSDMLAPEKMNELSLDQLMLINLFYHNRLAKEIVGIGKALMAIDSSGKVNEIKDLEGDRKSISQFVNRNFSERDIKIAKMKAVCLSQLAAILYSKMRISSPTKEDEENGYIGVDTQKDERRIEDQAKSLYEEFFYKISPITYHDYRREFNKWRMIRNIQENIYAIKDFQLSILINEMIGDKKRQIAKNFGIIEEDMEQSDPKKVLIGIDAEGFNMPIRFHLNRDDLIELLRINQGNTIVPIYEGSSDFEYTQDDDSENNIIRTSLLLPVTKEYIQNLRKLCITPKGKENERLLSHLRFISKGDKYPDHLKDKIVKKDGRTIFVARPKRYIDIVEGTKYYYGQNGYTEIDGDIGDKE